MGERETAKDHQLQEVGRGCAWDCLVHTGQLHPLHVLCVCPQVAAERVALQEECEKIQRMVRWWAWVPFGLLWTGMSFVSGGGEG